MPDKTVRLDVRLTQDGLTESREQAQCLIRQGQVLVSGKTVTKPAYPVGETSAVQVVGERPRYVGRGGYKLEAALEQCELRLDGMTALDVGASTGGFTQCMLRYGAIRVVAVDVGSGQLHASLRADPRVRCLESTDIRNRETVAAALPSEGADFASVDVSFISLSLVLPSVCALLKPDAMLVCLIKPQFEVGRDGIGKGGIVKDLRQHRRILYEWCNRFPAYGLSAVRLLPSPIHGGDGNGEYLAVLQYIGTAKAPEKFLETDVESALEEMRRISVEKRGGSR